ncbi:MAG: sugar phosphate nucleotidyltransferase [Myxococcota bacterium]
MTTLDDHVWVLVLAAGEGKRLRPVTRREDGTCVPKQFCRFFGGRSLLDRTLDRAERVADPERIVTVVAREHWQWWQPLLERLPPDHVVVQADDRGTAAGLLLPLARIARKDPRATVVVTPSDHFVADEEVLEEALAEAVGVARDSDAGGDADAPEERPAVLLGMTPDRPETGYGWIVPGPVRGDGAPGVEAFVEKPDETKARRLMDEGALWSSFLLVAEAGALLQVYARTTPGLIQAVDDLLRQEERAQATSPVIHENRALPDLDFSGDVLEAVPERLRVVAVPPCGWTDLGTPARLRACLDALAETDAEQIGPDAREVVDRGGRSAPVTRNAPPRSPPRRPAAAGSDGTDVADVRGSLLRDDQEEDTMGTQEQGRGRWVVILAAGDGARMRMGADGTMGALPKQYAALLGEQSLLERTLARAERLVSRDRIMVVVAEEHRRWWRPLLEHLPADNVVVQTHDRGLAGGVLLPLAVLASRDPEAAVMVMPADHHVDDEAVMHRSLEDSFTAAEADPEPVVLLGVTPEHPETGYGWIVPRQLDDEATPRVAYFELRPPAERAAELMDRDALWSSCLLTGRAPSLLGMFEAATPGLLRTLLGGLIMEQDHPGAPTRYHNEHVPRLDLSADVLDAARDRLRAIVVPRCGWTDLDTPDQLHSCLARAVRRSGHRRQPVPAGGP